MSDDAESDSCSLTDKEALGEPHVASTNDLELTGNPLDLGTADHEAAELLSRARDRSCLYGTAWQPAMYLVATHDAFQILRAAAERGYAPAQLAIGLAFASGVGTFVDVSRSLWWLEKAAHGGSSLARVKLAELGVNRRCSDIWLRADVADVLHEGSAYAMCVLGCQCSRGEQAGGWTAATKWWRSAAEFGHPLAQRNLALAYLEGKGVRRDRRTGLMWLRSASARGLHDAHRALKSLCPGYVGHKPAALKLLRCLAYRGDGKAQFDLGCAFAQGRNAFDGNDAYFSIWWNPITMIGRIAVWQGELLDRDLTSAIGWWEASARRGVLEAQCNLADVYVHGIGRMSPNLEKAATLLASAADQGCMVANVYLSRLSAQAPVSTCLSWMRLSTSNIEISKKERKKLARAFVAGFDCSTVSVHPPSHTFTSSLVGSTSYDTTSYTLRKRSAKSLAGRVPCNRISMFRVVLKGQQMCWFAEGRCKKIGARGHTRGRHLSPAPVLFSYVPIHVT